VVITVFSWEMKTPMAWATERVGRHHAIGADRSGLRSGCRATAANQATRPAAQTGVIRGIPIKPERCEVDGVVLIVIARTSQRAGACRSMISARVRLLEVKAPAAHEGDRFAQGGRNGGEKLLIRQK